MLRQIRYIIQFSDGNAAGNCESVKNRGCMSVTIVSPADLRLLIEKRIPLSIVDARGRLDYMNGHIPFAVPMNWEEWSARPPKECSLDLREPGRVGGSSGSGL